jgi:acyl-CoA thioesterase-1
MRHSIFTGGMFFILIFWNNFFLYCDQKNAKPSNTDKSQHAAASDSVKPAANAKNILFLGNSLSAGYGLDPELAFPALIQQKIDSLGWNFKVLNAGLSGETSSGGLRRVDWLLQRQVDVLVLELGANDGLRGITLDLTKKNLQAIIDRAKGKYPQVKIVIAGMQVPPNLGQEYTWQFRALYSELAKKNNALLIPFLLEGVGGIPQLNLPDGIHPTAEGHHIVAQNVWKVLMPLLKTMQSE